MKVEVLFGCVVYLVEFFLVVVVEVGFVGVVGELLVGVN